MNERLRKLNKYLFSALILIELLIIVLVGFRSHTNISLFHEPIYTLKTGWSYTDNGGRTHPITLPAKLDVHADERIAIQRYLPTNIDFLMQLSILTSHQNVEVYLENRLIYYRYNEPSDSLFDLPSASLWDIIKLPPHSEGKLISIVFNSPYEDYAGRIDEVHAGTTQALLLHSLETNGLNLLLAIITLIFGVLMIAAFLYMKRLIQISKSFLFLGSFTILCSIWLITESNLTQLFITNEYVISALTYLSLMTLPIPIIIYISYQASYHYKKTITYLTLVFIISDLILIGLQIFNILDFHESSFIVRSELFCFLGYVIITLLLEQFLYHNKEIRIFTVASVILFLFGLVELLTYHSRSSNIGVVFQFGFILFIIILTWDAIRRSTEIFKLSEKATHYKLLATRDPLTNCRSRVSYARDMENISLDRNITIFVADMNNMKEINDNYGHHTGDEVIILCSQCMLKVFGRRVYRIGGDEFVSVQYDLNQEGIDYMLRDFITECDKANEDIPYKFSMSVGYASFDKNIDHTIHDTIARADKAMYENKNRHRI